METNRTPEQVMLRAKIMYHVREFSSAVVSTLTGTTPRTHWRNNTVNRNHAVDRMNCEYHFAVVQELAVAWMDSTGERFPLPMFLQCVPGEYSKNGESILVEKVANIENAG